MSVKQKHIHKYMRVKWGKKGTLIFKCMLPNCPHYKPYELVRNSKSICWKCGVPFVMNLAAMQRKKPKCPKCTGRPEPKAVVSDKEILENIDSLLENL